MNLALVSLILFFSSLVYATDATRMAQEILDSSQATFETEAKDMANSYQAREEDKNYARSMAESYEPTESDKLQAKILADTTHQQEAYKEQAQSLLNSFDTGQSYKLQAQQLLAKSEKSCGSSKCGEGQVLQLEPEKTSQGSQLIVFVSLSMSEESLKAYSRDVAKVGGRLVIRGLVENSFQKTRERFQHLQIPVDIDPPLFEDYGVVHVPTFVHTKAGDQKKYDTLKGHISLMKALEIFKEQGEVKVSAQMIQSLKTGWEI